LQALFTFCAAETDHMPAQGFKPKSIFHQAEEPLKALAQIGRSNGQVNPGRRSKSKHKLKAFQHFDGPTQLHRVKIQAQFDSPVLG
jgi:hypothetical protein